jgi:hypothetical protein
VMLTIAIGAGGLVFVPEAWRSIAALAELPGPPAPEIFVILWAGCVGFVAFAWRGFGPRRAALATGVIAVASMIYLNQVGLPAAESFRDGKGFALRAKSELGDDIGRLGLYRTRDPVFYLGQPKPIAEFEDGESVWKAAAEGRIGWLILRRRDLDQIPMAHTILDSEASFAWEPENRRAGKLLLIRLD